MDRIIILSSSPNLDVKREAIIVLVNIMTTIDSIGRQILAEKDDYEFLTILVNSMNSNDPKL